MTTPTKLHTAPPESDLDLARAALGDEYEVVRELGRGGMAIVYHAIERAPGRDVAIKVLPSHFTFDESFVERFQREGRIAAQLEHPHVVPVYRVGRKGRVAFFVMKYLRGQSLAARLREVGRLPAAEARRVLVETASALGYAASRGVVHRDVKPDNIMLDEAGRCVVTDFGIARSAAEAKLTQTGMSVGTPRYMSPEQARAKPLDGRSDLYSLGIVGYECLAGRTPFDGEDPLAILMDHLKAPLPRPALGSSEEWELFEIVERLLEKNPDDRFQSAAELIGALDGSRPMTPRQPRVAPPGDDSGPQSAAALDRALAAGVELLREQRPKIAAGLRKLKEQRPRLEAGLGAGLEAGRTAIAGGRDTLTAQQPRLQRALEAASARVSAARHFVLGRARQLAIGGVAAALLTTTAYYGVHFATKHRSRCPEPAAATAEKAPAFTLLVESIATHAPGSNLQLYYDVCGLDAGTPYTAQLRIVKSESGIRRLLGRSVEPVVVSFDGSASGPRVRRHETIDFDDMPAGSYWMTLSVTDDRGRERRREQSFLLRDR